MSLHRTVLRNLTLPLILVCVLSMQVAAAKSVIRPGDRVLVLGDSITAAGHYVSILEAHLLTQLQGDPVTVMNLGLPSEGCTGLSEPDHPFPRPNVHERLKRALEKTRPDVVIACYGMNDGIYYPLSEERFEKYKQGMRRLAEVVKRSRARLILVTPPAFDPLPLKLAGKLLPAGAEKYAWFAIYEGYDEVIQQYSKWLMTQQRLADLVLDAYTPVVTYTQKKRQQDPKFVMSPDGVHVNREGHAVIARALVEGLGLKWNPDLDENLVGQLEARRSIMHAAWLTHVGHKRPGMKPGLPIDDAYAAVKELDRAIVALVAESK